MCIWLDQEIKNYLSLASFGAVNNYEVNNYELWTIIYNGQEKLFNMKNL